MTARIERDCSEETARQIDAEVKLLLDEAYADAKAVLVKHRDQLDLIATELLTRETLDAAAFETLLGRREASPPA